MDAPAVDETGSITLGTAVVLVVVLVVVVVEALGGAVVVVAEALGGAVVALVERACLPESLPTAK